MFTRLSAPIVALITHFPVLTVAAEGQVEKAEHAASGGAPHLPNIFSLLHTMGLMSDHLFEMSEYWVNVIYGLFTSLILVLIAQYVYRHRKIIPGPFQNGVEIVVEGLYNLFYGVMGEEARRYTPFLGTLFLYILINNFWGLVPAGHSPSTSLEITASLAIIVFIYSQYTGITRLGFFKWLDHLAGEPRSKLMWGLMPLLLIIHIVGEFAKPFSLAVRLFGNITGEDVLIAVFVSLGVAILSIVHSPVGLPIQVPFIFLGLLLSTIQALVFAMLSSVYLLLMLPHEEHEH